MAWNEVRHRARVVKEYDEVFPIEGNDGRLGQVFLNLLVNAAQAIPEGHADKNEIHQGLHGRIPGSRADIRHGQRHPCRHPSSAVRAFLYDEARWCRDRSRPGYLQAHHGVPGWRHHPRESDGCRHNRPRDPAPGLVRRAVPRGDQAGGSCLCPSAAASWWWTMRPSWGPRFARPLAPEHDVVVVASATDAITRIRSGERFGAILSDLMMPEVTGMEFYAGLKRVASGQAEKVIFMTGGAFSPAAREFLERAPTAGSRSHGTARNRVRRELRGPAPLGGAPRQSTCAVTHNCLEGQPGVEAARLKHPSSWSRRG